MSARVYLPLDTRKVWHSAVLYDSDNAEDFAELIEPSDERPANLVSSLCEDGLHRPAIDIDVPCRYVPSSTPGHGHLYFDETALTWEQYEALLQALVTAGIVEPNYLEHSRRRRQTTLRIRHDKHAVKP
jgi:hypothetical protein